MSSRSPQSSAVALDALLDAAPPLVNSIDDFVACIYDEPGCLDSRRAEVAASLDVVGTAVQRCLMVSESATINCDGGTEGSGKWFMDQFSVLVDIVGALEWPEVENTK